MANPPRQNPIEYGRYLADIGHCMECHTPFVKGQLDRTRWGGGGRELPVLPAGTVMSANLTPVNPGGMARWTNAQVKATISTGVRPDGRRPVRLMAFDWYRNVKDADLNALVAYLRTLKPVNN